MSYKLDRFLRWNRTTQIHEALKKYQYQYQIHEVTSGELEVEASDLAQSDQMEEVT
jgi:hypothetical protein